MGIIQLGLLGSMPMHPSSPLEPTLRTYIDLRLWVTQTLGLSPQIHDKCRLCVALVLVYLYSAKPHLEFVRSSHVVLVRCFVVTSCVHGCSNDTATPIWRYLDFSPLYQFAPCSFRPQSRTFRPWTIRHLDGLLHIQWTICPRQCET